MQLKRMWINQPSSSSQYYEYHRTNVLTDLQEYDNGRTVVYLLSGDIVSMVVHKCVLANGWNKHNAENSQTISRRQNDCTATGRGNEKS